MTERIIKTITFTILLALIACDKEEMAINDSSPVFTAYIENSGTKAEIDGTKVYWEDGDEIFINGTVFVAKVDKNYPSKATFSKKNSGDETPSRPYKAYYPASGYDNVTGEMSLPSLYEINTDNNFSGMNIMYAESNDTSLFFKNICSVIKLNVKGTDTIKAIKVFDRGKRMNGAFSIDRYCKMKMKGSSVPGITLDFGESGIKLNEDGSTFYVTIPPSDNYEDLSIKLIRIDGREYIKKTKGSVALERNSLYPIELVPEFKDSDLPPYLCFVAEEHNSSIQLMDPTHFHNFFYSYDGITWNYSDTGGGPVFKLAKYDKVYFRNFDFPFEDDYSYHTRHFIMSGKISAKGNIMSLIDSSCTQMTIPYEQAFSGLFSGCTSLVSAPDLPAMSLAKWCYELMFEGCINLRTAPDLPATSLARGCYMGMFKGCTNLAAAPDLPATSLVESCYAEMFSGCTSLATAPNLPVTSLAEFCYAYMFSGCTSLKTAPELPATVLPKNCYALMFDGCSKLNQIKVNFSNWTIWDLGYTTKTWVHGVASSGKFICPNGLAEKRGDDFIPYGWTIERY